LVLQLKISLLSKIWPLADFDLKKQLEMVQPRENFDRESQPNFSSI
jgi:hypothetical protein